MNLPLGRPFRLVARGEPGASCDKDGLALGGVPLVWRDTSEGRHRCEVRSLGDLSKVLNLAYGRQQSDVVARCHRGLVRVAARLEAADLALASMEAVMIGFPDLAPAAMAKLAKLADLEKAGAAWQTEPRIPAGQPGGGQWTTGSDGAAPGPEGRAEPTSPAPARRRSPLLGDGVYHPDTDHPSVVMTSGGEEVRQGIGGNEPPDDFMELSDLFPGLKDEPGIAIPLAPIDDFLGVGALADQANLDAFLAQYNRLVTQIRAIDPTWHDEELLPPNGFAGLPWQARTSVINRLRMVRAESYYRLRGNIRPLQVESLRFLQQAVDRAYEDAVARYNAGTLPSRLSRAEAIGNFVDGQVRDELKEFLRTYGIRFGPGQSITVNNRDISTPNNNYRVPDSRFGDIVLEWSLALKTSSTRQIRGFFSADSEPDAVVIIRPSQLGRGSTYLIPRPSSSRAAK